MKELNLPHQEPIKFAKYVLSKDENVAVVRVEFSTVPTLPMLVEAAAQSSAAFGEGEIKSGFLVALKNIKLLHKVNLMQYDIKVTAEHQFDALSYFSFEVIDREKLLVNGSFTIAIVE